MPRSTVSPRHENSQGGGPPGSVDEFLIVGATTLTIACTNTSTGPPATSCTWDFGDGSPTTDNCSGVSHDYPTARGLIYTVSLTMTNSAGVTSTATKPPDYVHVACQVPNFSNVHADDAQGSLGRSRFHEQCDHQRQRQLQDQRPVDRGGTLNPPNDCAASITLSN